MNLDRKILIDTSIMVDLLRGIDAAANWIDSIKPENRYLSFITAAELTAGCRNKDEQKKIERELKGYILLYLDPDDCKQALEWYKKFCLSHGVSFMDSLIAATGYKKNLQIATLNNKHFKHLTGISVIRPY